MKTIVKKIYMMPEMEVVQLQNQQPLLTGSNSNVMIGGRGDGGEIGDYDDPVTP
ncbi:hypothetical protein SAMN02910409_0180 [Prevotellaceae bacterium HUN156]|nr:hypothetical protein SAMN02910409_0180 [Prevotellaceae bacterium HUN156]